jgi:hypothetical protein
LRASLAYRRRRTDVADPSGACSLQGIGVPAGGESVTFGLTGNRSRSVTGSTPGDLAGVNETIPYIVSQYVRVRDVWPEHKEIFVDGMLHG